MLNLMVKLDKNGTKLSNINVAHLPVFFPGKYTYKVHFYLCLFLSRIFYLDRTKVCIGLSSIFIGAVLIQCSFSSRL